MVIIRRLISHVEAASVLEKLADENLLETGSLLGAVPFQPILPLHEKTRWYTREWNKWPSDIFNLRPRGDEFCGMCTNDPLVAASLPYFPTLEHVLWQFFGFRTPSWMDYFRGQVVLVLPDFRARISKLTIALGYLKADFECVFLRPDELVAKVYAENAGRLLAQETVHPSELGIQVDLDDRPAFASVALISKPTGETLHIKSFQEGRGWQDPDVILETSQQEIEQMLLVGESETLEFREKLQKESHLRLAKTAVAFANTKGGTIVIGVDDDHRVVGYETKGLSDMVTNVLRSYCDPPPMIETEVVQHEEKSLFLVKVIKSKGQVHSLKDHGPFIRTNATNRTPTSDELARLFSAQTVGPHSILSR
ncbi:MAG: ATP-binding protein [Terriglobia bacterium]